MPKTPTTYTPLSGKDRFYRGCFRLYLYAGALPLLLVGLALDIPGTIFGAGFTGAVAVLGLALTCTDHSKDGDPHA